MKKILYFVAVLATVAFTATSCKEKNNEPDEPQTDGRFVIEVKDVQYNSATAKVTAQDTTKTYIIMAVLEADFKKYDSDSAAIKDIKKMVDETIAYYNDYYKALYEAMGIEWTEEDEYTYTDFLSNGSKEYKVSGLAESTKYYEVLFEMDANGKTGSQLYRKAFETPAFKATSDLKITVSYEAPVLVFTPSNNTEKYFCNMVTEAELAEYGFANVTEMADDDISYYGEEFMEEYCEAGKVEIDLSEYEAEGYIESGEVAYGYAFGYKDGCRTTEVFSTKITYQTPAGAPARKANGKARLRPVKKQDARTLLRK